MEDIELYIKRIPNFNDKTSSQLIDYFAYYLQQVCGQSFFSASHIKKCFIDLALQPYSNIPAYLSKNTGKNGKYIKQSEGYLLNRTVREQIACDIKEIVIPPASTNLIDLSFFEKAPHYILSIVKEMVQCYDCGFYNATLVLMRKLVETLIIECFERYGIDQEIKDQNGVFLYLGDLIIHYIKSSKWNANRNIENSLKSVKKYGDLSAHNRRYLAKKSDIDSFKADLRQALQEIILTIDYPNWQR